MHQLRIEYELEAHAQAAGLTAALAVVAESNADQQDERLDMCLAYELNVHTLPSGNLTYSEISQLGISWCVASKAAVDDRKTWIAVRSVGGKRIC